MRRTSKNEITAQRDGASMSRQIPTLVIIAVMLSGCAVSRSAEQKPTTAISAAVGMSTNVATKRPDGPLSIDTPDGETVVVLTPDWKSRYPFSERFRVSGAARIAPVGTTHVVDLAALSFTTDDLVTRDQQGNRTFAEPKLTSFPRDLVRSPFENGGEDFFIVQAGSPAEQTLLREYLQKSGIEILDYLPQLAYLIRATSADVESLKQREEVFWLGFFHPAYRIDPKLDYIGIADPGHEVKMHALFDARVQPDIASLRGAIRGKGLSVATDARQQNQWLVRSQGRAIDARTLALIPGCLWVERWADPVLHNNVARTSANTVTGRGASNGPIMDVEDVWARGIRGEGQIASAADTGLDTGNLTTADSLHWDFGRVGNANNPMRVLQCYALGRATCDDDQSIGGGHGTHTSGSIVANGFRSGSTPNTNTFPTTSHAGTAPKAQFVFQSIMDSGGALGGLPADLTTLFQQAYTAGARVHSNSWGAPVAGEYTTDSQNVDKFSWTNKDMVITFSAGNNGVDSDYYTNTCRNGPGSPDGIIDADSIGAPGTAKNAITVGASENYRPNFVYEFPANDCTSSNGVEQKTWGWFDGCSYSLAPILGDLMANNANGIGAFSSRGPTDDGRTKPDIVAPGIAIISTRTSVNQAYEQWGICDVAVANRPYYITQGGTSMSNPLTAGAATLVRQYFVDGWHANNSLTTNASAVGGDGFAPSAALVKATLINGAWDMSPGQYGTGATKELPPSWESTKTIPNNVMGYGRVDVEHSLFPGSGWGDDANRKLEVHDVTTGLTTGGSNIYNLTVVNGNDPLIVTLAWTDPYAATGAGTKLVNNLDLTVSDGVTTWYPGGVNKTSGADNLNNVEQVYLTVPAAGNYTVTVSGTSVPGNGVAGTTTQPYALVISGVLAPPCTPPATPSGVNASGTAPNQITVGWNQVSGVTGYNVYRSNGACPGGTFSLVGTVNGAANLSFVDNGVTGGNTYSYKVTAYTSCESAQSSCVQATAPSCTVPGVPTITSVDNSVTYQLTVNWTAGSPAGATYEIYRAASTCPATTTLLASGVTGTSYVDNTVSGGTTYAYQVVAVDSTGNCKSAKSTCLAAAAVGGPNLWSTSMLNWGRPQDTLTSTSAVRWMYNTRASALTPPGLDAANVYTVSNDRFSHALRGGDQLGDWPAGYKPLSMNRYSQSRPIIFATPNIAGSLNTVFISSHDGHVYAINAATGGVAWRTASPLGEFLQATPIFLRRDYTGFTIDLVLIGTRNGSTGNKFYALNGSSGAVVWEFSNSVGEGGNGQAIGIISGSPAIDSTNKRIYFASRGNSGGSPNTMWAISFTASSATFVWGRAVGDIDGSPTLVNGRLYVGNNAGEVLALDASVAGSGAPVWTASANQRFSTSDGPVKGFILIDRNSSPFRLYFATTNTVWSIRDDGTTATEMFRITGVGSPSIPTLTGSRPIFGGRALIFGSSNGSVYQLSGLTVTPPALPTQKSVSIGATPLGSPVFNGATDLIYVGSDSGSVYAVKAQ